MTTSPDGSSGGPIATWPRVFGWIGSTCAGLAAAWLIWREAWFITLMFWKFGEGDVRAWVFGINTTVATYACVLVAGVTAPTSRPIWPGVLAWANLVGYRAWVTWAAPGHPRWLESLIGLVVGLALAAWTLHSFSKWRAQRAAARAK